MMTPQEVAGCTFTKAVMGGYNMAAVDDFLDKLTEDYSALHTENTALKAKLKVLVDKLEEYREMEDAMRSTLLTAQKMATNLVSEAEQKRDAILSDTAAAARARLAEIQQELADEEARLVQARRDVDSQIEAENRRLTSAQEGVRTFIQSVEAVCSGQLELLRRLPELPEEPEAAPVQQEAPAEEPADETDTLEDNISETIAAFAQTKEEDLEDEDDPFSGKTPDDEDSSSTRVLNLDDLQFGRNYSRE